MGFVGFIFMYILGDFRVYIHWVYKIYRGYRVSRHFSGLRIYRF